MLSIYCLLKIVPRVLSVLDVLYFFQVAGYKCLTCHCIFFSDIPWLNFGLSYPLPAMLPMCYADRSHCTLETFQNWHKANDSKPAKSDEISDKTTTEDTSSDGSISVE